MPLPKFYSLKNKKKNNIMESIGSILSKKNFDDISIVAIAEEAEISRGTFYNYFEDKNDAIKTYVEYYFEKFIEYFKSSLLENDNDFMKTTRQSYDKAMEVFKNEIYKAVVKNTRYMMETARVIEIEQRMSNKMSEFIEYLYNNIDKNKLYVKNKSDMAVLVQIVGSALVSALARFSIGEDVTKLNEQFNIKMNIIEKGMKV